MNRISVLLWMGSLCLILAFFQSFAQAQNHDQPTHTDASEEKSKNDLANHAKEAGEESGIYLTPEQINTGGIVSEALQLSGLASEIRAPGEIQLNAYATSKVAPRISAQLLSRKARLGDTIKKGQVLVVLSSIEMAQAQGESLVAEREWRRVKKLGRSVVSEQRYTQAKVTREQARAKVLAYGMDRKDLEKLLAGGKAEQADGRFKLLAQQDGTVIRDDFVLGELVEPGRVLFEISDESTLWVEARLTPDQAVAIKIKAPATAIYQKQSIQGKVIQIHHALDESTRTLGVRIEIPNPDDRLHPGLFVEARIQGSTVEQVLAIPSDAVLRSSDGDWQVFVEYEAGTFKPVEVDVGRSSGGMTVIKGLDPGTKVVTKGAFFLQSEAAKSGFEVHDH